MQKIQYTTNGSYRTQHSTYNIELANFTEISETEFKNAPAEKCIRVLYNNGNNFYDLTQYHVPQNHSVPNDINGRTSYTINTDMTDGDNIRYGIFYNNSEIEYYQCIISEITYSYIQVKILDYQTLAIRDGNGETIYTVTSYNITYFEE